ncbi:MAG: thioredoxin domain-containing protein [Alphaproteobacteria bacterium]
MTNHLAAEVSPYLLQHKDNPVHWWPWGEAAFAAARDTNRPILLSVGYAACHWCHVMAHESFEDQSTAALMNQLFVNIKVDREERPDVDQIYMAALHAIGEQGGWPLTMFLTPGGEPFWGGTYFPPTERYGRPSFTRVLREIARVFHDEPARILNSGSAIAAHLNAPPPASDIAVDRPLLDSSGEQLLGLMDTELGGTRGAPKFPQTSLFECLWRAGARTANKAYADVVDTTLSTICQGGIYDHIGGGFARYAVDARWLVPHFEKMLYDNAQLVELLALVGRHRHGQLFTQRIDETITWLTRDMVDEGGAFTSSLDADSEGEEGRYYVWTPTEVSQVLSPDDAALFGEVYDIRPGGNWEGHSIANRLGSSAMDDPATALRLAAMRAALLTHRAGRVPPTRDDKILADWNGLAIAAISLAGFLHDRPDWVAVARTAYAVITDKLMIDGRLAHAYRAGRTVFPGLATDYAFMIKAALALYTATGHQVYVNTAESWVAKIDAHHRYPDGGGYFLSAGDAEDLIARPRAERDDATPAASAVMASNLIRLWQITGKDNHRAAADDMLQAAGTFIANNIYGSTSYLNALDLRLGVVAVVIIAADHRTAQALMDVVRETWTGNMVLTRAASGNAIPPGHPAHGKTAIAGAATAYVCREGSCSLPVSEPGELRRLLSD